MGELREAIHEKLQEKRLIKVLYADKMSIEEINGVSDELSMVYELNHPTIMKVFEFSYDPTSQKIFVVMENFVGRPLFDKLREEQIFDEEQVKKVMR